jgi:predicted dienelactone hydrolase
MRRLVLSLSCLIGACSTAAPEATGNGSATAVSASVSDGSTSEDVPTATTSGGAGTGDDSDATPTGDPGGTGDSAGVDADYDLPGEHPVGVATFTLTAGDRTLLVEAWYPAIAGAKAEAEAGASIAEFVPPGPDRDTFDGLLADLSESGKVGTRLQTRSARDADPADMSPKPVIVFSHCHACTRFSAFTLAEHLASRGYVVVAPDHAGNTLFDQLAGQGAEVGEDFLKVRVADLSAVLDAVLDPQNQAVPAAIRGAVDPARVGALGHSFGAGTAGRLAQEDDRVVAALPIGAPPENPLFPGTKIANIAEPTLFVKLLEDNSIGAVGNGLIESNFKSAATPTWIVRVRDAGHWGVTDICGLVADFDPGCGPGTRMTDGTAFTYLDPQQVRTIAAAYAAAFFDLHLRADPSAAAYLMSADPPDLVEVDARM